MAERDAKTGRFVSGSGTKSWGVTWIPGSLAKNLNDFDDTVNAMVAVVVDYSADRAVGWMKTNAPWRDRTGNARQTLNAKPEHDGFSHAISLFGGMPYQIWLEIRWAGKYAIISKAVKTQGIETMKRLKGLLDRLGRL